MTSIIYYGVPPSDDGWGFVRFIDSDDPADHGRDLPAKHVNGLRFEWGYIELNGKPTKVMVPGAAPLALAICCHALASDERGLKIYQRFKLRVMEKWARDQPWAISAEEVAAVADRIEGDELTPQQLHAIERERPPPESEAGRGVEGAIVWDTDEKGNWIKPRHGGNE
jgi:hypothetical protein